MFLLLLTAHTPPTPPASHRRPVLFSVHNSLQPQGLIGSSIARACSKNLLVASRQHATAASSGSLAHCTPKDSYCHRFTRLPVSDTREYQRALFLRSGRGMEEARQFWNGMPTPAQECCLCLQAWSHPDGRLPLATALKGETKKKPDHNTKINRATPLCGHRSEPQMSLKGVTFLKNDIY